MKKAMNKKGAHCESKKQIVDRKTDLIVYAIYASATRSVNKIF